MKSKINTLEDAFTLLGRDRNAIVKVMELLPEDIREDHISDNDLDTLIEALNMEANDGKKWIPNYSDDEPKYEPRFWMNDEEGEPAGSGFSFTHCVRWRTDSHAGSRRCFINYETMEYAIENFLEVYKRAFIRA